MKYIKNHTQFVVNKKVFDKNDIKKHYKKSAIVNEVLDTGSLTWGGSLIGRLFSSIGRLLRIEYNKYKIKNLIGQLEGALQSLCIESKLDDPKEIQTIRNAKMFYILREIRKVSRSKKMTEEEKIKSLVGEGKKGQGLINRTIEWIESNLDENILIRISLIDEYIKSKEQIENIKNQDFIGIQRIRTNSLDFKSRWLILQYFEKGFIPIDSIGYFLKKSNLELKYLQTILSSQLMNLYYKLHYTDKNVKPIYLKKLPIKEISLKEQEPFIQKADLMLELNKKLQELKQNFINELNLEKIPTKLQKFEELDFDDFVKEYAKAKKLKFADKLEERNFKNEWQRLFENDKKEVLEIQNQINITDKEIDQMVYKLYDLTPDEIKIIEGN